jgi:hypothetical protein
LSQKEEKRIESLLDLARIRTTNLRAQYSARMTTELKQKCYCWHTVTKFQIWLSIRHEKNIYELSLRMKWYKLRHCFSKCGSDLQELLPTRKGVAESSDII